MFDFPALFFGVKFGLGEAILAVAARRGIRVRVSTETSSEKAQICLRTSLSLQISRPLRTAISTVSSQVFLVLPSAAPGFGPVVHHRSGTVSTCVDVHRTVESSSKRRKEHWQHGLRLSFVLSSQAERSGRCTATLESPADPGVDPNPSAGLLPTLASIIVEPDAVRAIHNICCFGPPHWKEQCWVGFLPSLEAFEKRCCCKIPHVALSSRATTRAAASYPPQLCEEYANLWLGAMTNRDVKLNVLDSSASKGQHGSKVLQSDFQGPPLELVEKVRRAIQKEFTLEPVLMPKPSFGLPSNVRADILCGVIGKNCFQKQPPWVSRQKQVFLAKMSRATFQTRILSCFGAEELKNCLVAAPPSTSGSDQNVALMCRTGFWFERCTTHVVPSRGCSWKGCVGAKHGSTLVVECAIT